MVSSHDARIRWGILSTGHIASVLDPRPRAAARRGRGGRRRLALGPTRPSSLRREHEIPRAYGSYAELAADPEVDVIYVASTHNDHLGSARLCLEAGKAVLVEKPLTVSAAETEELVDLAGERGHVPDGGAVEPHQPAAASGGADRPRRRAGSDPARRPPPSPSPSTATNVHRLLDPDQAGGAILDLGVYPVHGINLFLGSPISCSGFGSLASIRWRPTPRRC